MDNELLGWARVGLAGAGTTISGLVLFFIKRLVNRRDAQEARRVAWGDRVDKTHRRYDRNFIRIAEHSNLKLETLETEE